MKSDLYNMREVYYQDMLRNYRKEPREENWQSIEAQLREDNMNMQLKSKFDNFAVIPPANNWDNIESKLQEPVFQQPVNYGLRIAASICLMLFAVSFSSDKQDQDFNEIFQGLAITESVDFNLCQDPALIELDIVKIKPVRKKPKKRKKNAVASTKQKTLLDIILAVDDDIAATIDSALIADLIKPAEILSEEDMYATTSSFNLFNRDHAHYRKMYFLPEVIYNLEMPADSMDTIFTKTNKP